jgi:hypothetical protein
MEKTTYILAQDTGIWTLARIAGQKRGVDNSFGLLIYNISAME